MQRLTDAEKAAMVRRRVPGVKWSDSAHRWLVPMDALLELVMSERRHQGLSAEPPQGDGVSFLVPGERGCVTEGGFARRAEERRLTETARVRLRLALDHGRRRDEPVVQCQGPARLKRSLQVRHPTQKETV